MIALVRDLLIAESPVMAGLLYAAEAEPWCPVDWSLVPAWSAWRAEVGARRRLAAQPDALLWAAYCESEACLAAQSGNAKQSAWWLAQAADLIRESADAQAAA